MDLELRQIIRGLERQIIVKDIGKVTDVVGPRVEGYLPGARIGSLCDIFISAKDPIPAEVVGFRDKKVIMMPLAEMNNLSFGAKIELRQAITTIKLSDDLLGRVVDGLGRPIDDLGSFTATEEAGIYKSSVNPMERPPISERVDLGIKSINSFLTVGKGQRVGIFAGSGVGKSVLMGMIARSTQSQVNVIAMVGERGREVREFVENVLGEEGLKKSVVVAVTSDMSPLLRMRGAFVATAIAEYFAKKGDDVLLMMDSLTRFSMAQREIGLNVGEPVTTKGYTPSVFSILPKLLERAGQFDHGGSITGLYTVLVEGDDMDDPIADAVRSIVDGHITLDRKLAQLGHFPAIDILQSASRVMSQVAEKEHRELAQRARAYLALYRENEDLISIGAYREGNNPQLDEAVMMYPELMKFLKQSVEEEWSFEQGLIELQRIMVYGEEV